MSVAINSRTASLRGADLYESPPEATETLLRIETLPQRIWEPACGRGAISSILMARGHDVVSTDLNDWGWPEAQTGIDFLMEYNAPEGVDCIVSNPPFKLSDAFVRHGLTLVSKIYILQRLLYLEGAGRSDIIDKHLSRVWLGRERLPMMHAEGFKGKKQGTGNVPYAWFVFERSPETPGHIDLRRMSWRAKASGVAG